MLAALSRRRSWVQIPSGALDGAIDAARYANRQSGQVQTLVTCGFDSHSCHFLEKLEIENLESKIGRVVFLTAVCKAVAFNM